MSEKGIDRLVRQAIAHARAIKPDCSVREAAEMTAGRRLSNDEWERKGPIWLRNWGAHPRPDLPPDHPGEVEAGSARESTHQKQGRSINRRGTLGLVGSGLAA